MDGSVLDTEAGGVGGATCDNTGNLLQVCPVSSRKTATSKTLLPFRMKAGFILIVQPGEDKTKKGQLSSGCFM